MAKRMTTGIDDVIKQLDDLAKGAKEVLGFALYEGAGVMADAYKSEIMQLPIGTPKKNSTTGHPFTGLTEALRTELANGVGIAEFDDTGDGRSTAISINGYSETTGQPLVLIARSLESGSSVRAKNPFVRRAERKALEACERAIEAAGNQKIREIAGEG